MKPSFVFASFLIIFIVCLLSFYSSGPATTISDIRMLREQSRSNNGNLNKVLRRATMASRTVILTMVDKSWAQPGSVLDLFLESFRIREETKRLLNHLIIVALDSQAFKYCNSIHPHCIHPETNRNGRHNVSGKPFKSMFNLMRNVLLRQVLDNGYYLVYTDADVMWLRNPFPLFDGRAPISIGCDFHLTNQVSGGGLFYMTPVETAVEFFKLWSLIRVLYHHTLNNSVCQMAMNEEIVQLLKLRVKLIDTKYYGGFCRSRRDHDLSEIYTFQANCCDDLDSKVHDLKLVLDGLRKFRAMNYNGSGLVLLSSLDRGAKCLTR